MSNIDLIIEERARDIGNFTVGRLLPFHSKRTVGPFIFIDHMGPVQMGADQNMDVPPHPHIGLSTLTYLIEGHVMHRDSIGTEIEIEPGQVNWMTAGSGIVHSERSPDRLRHTTKTLHGLQIWVALPKHLEQMAPQFYHAGENDLPVWERDGLHFKLIAGQAFGSTSPVPVYSPLFLLEVKASEDRELSIGDQLPGELGVYILEGSVQADGHVHGSRRILIPKQKELCSIRLSPGTCIYLFGGESLAEERLIWWNFVASSQQLIDDAKLRWKQQEFPKIKGEVDFVPLPSR